MELSERYDSAYRYWFQIATNDNLSDYSTLKYFFGQYILYN